MHSKQSSSAPAVVQSGDTVKVHYTCKLDDETVFATTRNKEPVEFEVGSASVILGLQEAVVGMTPGDSKRVAIPPTKAYGPYHEEMKATLDRSMVPSDVELEVGVALRVKHSDGHESDAFVTAFTDETVSVDGNHPLAGKNLVMEIELVEIVD